MNIAATPHAPDRIGPEKVLVIVGHPDLGRSSFSAGLIPALKSRGARIHGLANALTNTRSDASFDPMVEVPMIKSAERLILVFPIHWYGPPSLVVKWLEEVLTPDGKGPANAREALAHKPVDFVVSTGGKAEDYQLGGRHGRPTQEYLHGVSMAFTYFGAVARPAKVFHAAWRFSAEEIEAISADLLRLEANA